MTELRNKAVKWFKAWKTWEFKAEGEVEITQRLEFQRDAQIKSWYNCFLSIARNEDSELNATTAMYGAASPYYEKQDLVLRDHAINHFPDAKKAIAWGGGVQFEAEFLEGYKHQDPDYIDYDPNENYMFFQGNADRYNKMYFKQGFSVVRVGAKTFSRYRYKVTSTL